MGELCAISKWKSVFLLLKNVLINFSKFFADEGISVVVEELHTHPVCEHGPTILFEHKNNNENVRKFFACSAYRERKDCPVHIPFDQWSYQVNRTQHQSQLDEFLAESSKIAIEQQSLLQGVSLVTFKKVSSKIQNIVALIDWNAYRLWNWSHRNDAIVIHVVALSSMRWNVIDWDTT